MSESSVAPERRTSERRSFSSFNGLKIDRRCGFDRRTGDRVGEDAWRGDDRRVEERRGGEDRRVVTERRTFQNS